jgi:LysM repeat protein
MARRLPAVAAPVLCGAAAAFAVVGTPATSTAATQAHSGHTTAAVSVKRTGATSAKPSAAPVKYTVKSGDTLSAIAQRYYKDPNFWPAIYWANHSRVRYANIISVGQVLTVPAKPAHAQAAPSIVAPASAPVHTSSYAPPVSARRSAPSEQTSSAASTTVSTSGDSAFQACVISRESGGNSQVMNSSGHYGLYQFSASTWAAYGGNPADFGHASVSEQNRVFSSAMAAGGESNWAPYDGC